MQMNPTIRNSHSYIMESKSSNSTVKKLSRYSRAELVKLRDKNSVMLSNQSVIDTLPDKGAKLQETNQIINTLLSDISTEDEVTVSNTSNLDCPLTRKLEDMSVLTPRQGARKRSVDLANQQAFNHYTSSGLLTKPKRSNSGGYSSSSIFYNNQHYYHQRPQPATANVMCEQAKVRMLTLDESMTLQTEQRSSVINSEKQFDFNKPSKSLLNTLNLSIDLIQDVDINAIELPQEEDSEDEYNNSHDVEAMVID